MAAIVSRNLRTARRYPLQTSSQLLLTPLYQLVLPTLLLGAAFLVDGRAVGLAERAGTDDLGGWLGLGLVIASVTVGVIWTMSGDLMGDRMTGTIEVLWAGSSSPRRILLGSAASGFLLTTTASLLLVVLTVPVLGAHYRPAGLLATIPVLAFLFVAVAGYGYLLAAATLLLRRATSLIEVVGYLVTILSGVAFPVSVLPQPLLGVAEALPTTWALHLLRYVLLDARLPVSELGSWSILAVSSGVVLLVGVAAFDAAVRRVRQTGAIAQY